MRVDSDALRCGADFLYGVINPVLKRVKSPATQLCEVLFRLQPIKAWPIWFPYYSKYGKRIYAMASLPRDL